MNMGALDMKLVIDCFKLVKGAGKSIGIYNLTLNLVRELAGGNNHGNHQIVVFGNSYNKKDFDVPGVKFCKIGKNPLNKLTCIVWELFGVSVMAKRMRADRILFPRGYATMLHMTEEYVIIHDMIPFYYKKNYPGYFNRLENFYITWRLKVSARKADKVITISEASKRDIIRYAHLDSNRITVIYNGYTVSPGKYYTEPEEDYIIAMTSVLPHKNAEGIVKSYEIYYGLTDRPLPIKIIGLENIARYPLSEEISKRITCIKYVEDNEDLYRFIYGAKVFVFLSFVEGFGFPPIEAMQLGTPVICSDQSSLPEVVGNAAVYVSPSNYVQVAKAIHDVVTGQVDVDALRRRGKENVERFNWHKTGKEYRKILFSEKKLFHTDCSPF